MIRHFHLKETKIKLREKKQRMAFDKYVLEFFMVTYKVDKLIYAIYIYIRILKQKKEYM